MTAGGATARHCAQRLKLLADSTRFRVMELLLDSPLHVGELQRRLGIEQSLLSHHLRVLRRSGLVRSERHGRSVRYEVAPGVGLDGSGTGIDLGCCVVSFNGTGGRGRHGR